MISSCLKNNHEHSVELVVIQRNTSLSTAPFGCPISSLRYKLIGKRPGTFLRSDCYRSDNLSVYRRFWIANLLISNPSPLQAQPCGQVSACTAFLPAGHTLYQVIRKINEKMVIIPGKFSNSTIRHFKFINFI